MNRLAPRVLTQWLRATGDPSRLRLLVLCAEGALSVSELAGALRQSEPRTSRHLRILCDAGLIERLRQGQRVHYRMSGEPAPASFVRGLLAQLDHGDPVLAQDRCGARALAGANSALGAESRLGRSLANLLSTETATQATGALLLIGVTHPELLASAARGGDACTAIAQSRRAAQWAQAFAERAGVSCRIIEAASPEGFGAADLARSGGPFDSILIDQSGGGADGLPLLLSRARGALSPSGRLWVFERYDSLDTARDRIVEHPIARLRRLLSDAGLRCEKISPVEADGEHVLAARASPVSADLGLRDGAAGAA